MAYPAKLWAKIKADYETGDYSQEDLSKKYSIPRVTIDKKCVTEKWDKGKLKPIVEQTIQQKLIAALAARGVDEKKVSNTIAEMLDADKTVIIPSGREGQSGFAEQIPDWQARDKALTQYGKFTGSYAADKTEGKMNIQIDGLDDILAKVYPDDAQ